MFEQPYHRDARPAGNGRRANTPVPEALTADVSNSDMDHPAGKTQRNAE
jgi:hypothetical protein